MFALSSSSVGAIAARHSLRRCFFTPKHARSAAAARYYATAVPSPLVAATKLDHGLNVVAVDDGTEACVVSLAFPAGPRHEKLHERGLAHHLKNWAFQDCRSFTALATTREAEIRGGTLSASITREHLFLTAECLRNDLAFFLKVLREVAYHTLFQVHEGGAVGYLVQVETNRAANDPNTVINEALHRVAFRRGLGNSLFSHSPMELDLSTVKSFGERQFGFGDRVALVSSGVSVAELESHARDLLSPAHVKLNKGSVSMQPSKYYGGEDRIDVASAKTGHFVVAYPSGASGSAFDSAARVLKAHLGIGKSTYYGSGTSPLARIATETSTDIQPFSYSYSDAGLFGVRIQSGYDKAQSAVSAALAEIKKAADGIPEAEFKKAVAIAKTGLLSSLENKVALVECLGAQVVGHGKAAGPVQLVERLDALKPADVSKLAATMIKSKPTVVAYGNTLALPYADSL